MIIHVKTVLLMIFYFISFLQISAFSQNDGAEKQFRVMTYNIRYAGDEKIDGVNAWSKRKELVASMIRFNHADIIGVQEALISQLNDLTNMLDGYSWFGAARDDGSEKGEFSAVLFDVHRFKVIEQSTFWLSTSPDVPSKGWDAAFPRVVTWGKIKDLKTEEVFFVFNTHFDHIGETARINSAKLLKNKIAEIASNFPVILMGDFNTQDSTIAYEIVTSTSSPSPVLYDAQFISKTKHHGSHVTFNDFGRSIEQGNKIDFIFVNEEFDVLQHGVIDEVVDGQYPSDHMPVLAEIRIR